MAHFPSHGLTQARAVLLSSLVASVALSACDGGARQEAVAEPPSRATANQSMEQRAVDLGADASRVHEDETDEIFRGRRSQD